MLLPQTSRNRRAVQYPRRRCPLCWVWEGNCWTMEGRKRWSHLQDATTNLRSLRSPRTKQQRVSCWRWLTASLKTDSWVFGFIFKLNYIKQNDNGCFLSICMSSGENNYVETDSTGKAVFSASMEQEEQHRKINISSAFLLYPPSSHSPPINRHTSLKETMWAKPTQRHFHKKHTQAHLKGDSTL